MQIHKIMYFSFIHRQEILGLRLWSGLFINSNDKSLSTKEKSSTEMVFCKESYKTFSKFTNNRLTIEI